MICPNVLADLCEKCHKTEDEILSILNPYFEMEQLGKNSICFIKSKIIYLPGLNANSSFYRIILVSEEWALRLINSKDELTQTAFLLTIGHELGHKQKHINRLLHLTNLKFLSWIQEVYCDFYGAVIFGNKEKDKLIESIVYKSQDKNLDYYDASHPSWNLRLKYAKVGKFDEELIKQIYKDSDCKSKKILNKVIKFYKNRHIILY